MEDKKKEKIDRLDESIKKLKKKDFKIYFFIIDTKGAPNGSTQYIYTMAKTLHDLGYNVELLHQDEDFIGVGDWMGEEYASLPHSFIKAENIKVNVRDFFFIPEIFANVMSQTKILPCKRIAISQNLNFISEFIGFGDDWGTYGINKAITTTNEQAKDIKELFPFTEVDVLNPSIPDYFRKTEKPKKLEVVVLTKDQSLFAKIIKQFYWKYPLLKWVVFPDVRGLPKESVAEVLRETEITVWVDDDTYFGYNPIEAIKSGSILIGKVPNVIPEWMYDESGENLNSRGIWFTDLRDVQKIIAQAIFWVMEDRVPEKLTEEMEEMKNLYTHEEYKQNLEKLMGKYIDERINELEDIKDKIK